MWKRGGILRGTRIFYPQAMWMKKIEWGKFWGGKKLSTGRFPHSHKKRCNSTPTALRPVSPQAGEKLVVHSRFYWFCSWAIEGRVWVAKILSIFLCPLVLSTYSTEPGKKSTSKLQCSFFLYHRNGKGLANCSLTCQVLLTYLTKPSKGAL